MLFMEPWVCINKRMNDEGLLIMMSSHPSMADRDAHITDMCVPRYVLMKGHLLLRISDVEVKTKRGHVIKGTAAGHYNG